jgi:hypothetical protein
MDAYVSEEGPKDGSCFNENSNSNYVKGRADRLFVSQGRLGSAESVKLSYIRKLFFNLYSSGSMVCRKLALQLYTSRSHSVYFNSFRLVKRLKLEYYPIFNFL